MEILTMFGEDLSFWQADKHSPDLAPLKAVIRRIMNGSLP